LKKTIDLWHRPTTERVSVYTNFSTRAACGCVRDGKIRYVRRYEATVTKCAVVEDRNRGATITLSFHYIR